MTEPGITTRPVSPALGAEVEGIDLSEPLTAERHAEIRALLNRHLVLFFRDQDLTLEQHKELGRGFGDLHIHPAAPKVDDHPEVIRIHADRNSRVVAGMKWHADVTCDAQPPMGSILHLHQVPPVGGDTMFANMYAAFEALSLPMQRFLEGLTAVHESAQVHRDRFGFGGELRDGANAFPEARHPVVCTHPETGRRLLFVNENFTTRIEGLAKNESSALLAMLFEHIATPEFHCRFTWTRKAVAFWDNRCTQHRTVWDYWPATRHGYRVTIAGDNPV